MSKIGQDLPDGGNRFCRFNRSYDLIGLLTRRQVLVRTSTAALAALVASAVPLAGGARAADLLLDDATLQAFADTILPDAFLVLALVVLFYIGYSAWLSAHQMPAEA